jgi:uncharacterized SAM-binding protein YcdF (DUF218 family)
VDDFIQGAIRTGLTLVEPIGLIWLAMLLLTVLLWRKRQRGFAVAAGALAAAIYVIGATDVPGILLRSLERPYAGVNYATLPTADAVLLLGGAVGPSRNEVGGLHLNEAGDRVIMALEMIRLGKASVLVCSGGKVKMDGREVHEADLLKRAIEERVSIPEIISLGACSDTHDEAVHTLELAHSRGWQRLLLVSSASHLPRAVATFRTLGLTVIPVPCDFRTTLSTAQPTFSTFVPGHGGFEMMSVWMHETIGWWEYRRRGWIDPTKGAP